MRYQVTAVADGVFLTRRRGGYEFSTSVPIVLDEAEVTDEIRGDPWLSVIPLTDVPPAEVEETVPLADHQALQQELADVQARITELEAQLAAAQLPAQPETAAIADTGPPTPAPAETSAIADKPAETAPAAKAKAGKDGG